MTGFEAFVAGEPVSQRDFTMIALLGPAIAGEARSLTSAEPDVSGLEATTRAVHSAISTMVLRQDPNAVDRRPIEYAVAEFEARHGMCEFPAPSNSGLSIEHEDWEARKARLTEARARHLQAMRGSRYSVTLGDILRLVLPVVNAFDQTADELTMGSDMVVGKHAFQGIWHNLIDQNSHVKHFSLVMESIHYRSSARSEARQVPSDPDNLYGLDFVMTEADVRRIIAAPIAAAFETNAALLESRRAA